MELKYLYRTTRNPLGDTVCPPGPALSLPDTMRFHTLHNESFWGRKKRTDRMAALTQIGSPSQEAERVPSCSPCKLNPQLCPPRWESWRQLTPLLRVKKRTIYYKGPSLNQSLNLLPGLGAEVTYWACPCSAIHTSVSCPHLARASPGLEGAVTIHLWEPF